MTKQQEMKKLQKENEKIRDKIECICDDFGMEESRKNLWKHINTLIENEIQQEELCGE